MATLHDCVEHGEIALSQRIQLDGVREPPEIPKDLELVPRVLREGIDVVPDRTRFVTDTTEHQDAQSFAAHPVRV